MGTSFIGTLLSGLYMQEKVSRALSGGHTAGRIAKNLRKQGVPFGVAYALIFNKVPRNVYRVVDLDVGALVPVDPELGALAPVDLDVGTPCQQRLDLRVG